MSFSEKYSTIADQVAAAASVSFELQAQNEKVYLLHATSSAIEACVLTRRLQVAEFVTEVDALHSELERLENSARVNTNVFALCASRYFSHGFRVNCGVQCYFLIHNSQPSQELDTFSIQLEKAFRQAAAKTK
jgi:hypothetical protein